MVSTRVTDDHDRRLRLRIDGQVQGVGFRPFVYRLATECGLTGFVRNTNQGVTIEVQGEERRLGRFRERLDAELPLPANIRRCDSAWCGTCAGDAFVILDSDLDGDRTATVLPDLATCTECLREVFDPSNRRYLYPFTNCTHCGPRYSIIRGIPYDRSRTTMARFTMCSRCAAEYADPHDRRFHAQPNACPVCGPTAELWSAEGRVIARRHDAVLAAAEAIRSGGIIALKGLGGFQLVVDAFNNDAVVALRERKHRCEKPFAVMCADESSAAAFAMVDDASGRVLRSPAAPIVLLPRSRDLPQRFDVAGAVAAESPYLGMMLPCTPLHHLLLGVVGRPVVATSGNISDEPICIDEHEALDRLRGVADVFLVHDRPIGRRLDDSVVSVVDGQPAVVRCARGVAPMVVPMPRHASRMLAVGGHQKNAVAVAHNHRAILGQHVGDLVNRSAYKAFTQAADDLAELLDVKPEIIACDSHPEYLSTKYARTRPVPSVSIQHHEAHVASCMAEHGIDTDVLGVAWDGTGLGHDGTIWGGEFIEGRPGAFRRVGHLAPFLLPGGDAAAREPWRSALGVLYAVYGDRATEMTWLPPVARLSDQGRRVMATVLHRRLHCAVTSSMGRLFDAVASLVGLRQSVSSEGLAAMALEFAATGVTDVTPYPLGSAGSTAGLEPDARAAGVVPLDPIVKGVLGDIAAGVAVPVIARRFHLTLSDVVVQAAQRAGRRFVLLTGGCFQNRLLLEDCIRDLRLEGFEPRWHRTVPPTDGGLALGQLAIAAAMKE